MGGGCGQPPVPSCRMTPAMGEVGPPARPTATSPQAIATPLPRPRTNNVLKKKESFSRGFGRQGPGPARRRPGRPQARAAVADHNHRLIAQ